jgi:hypothetical protein
MDRSRAGDDAREDVAGTRKAISLVLAEGQQNTARGWYGPKKFSKRTKLFIRVLALVSRAFYYKGQSILRIVETF